MITNNRVDLKAAKSLPEYVIFECAHLKILPLEQYFPEEQEHSRCLNKPPLALVLRIVTNEICIVLAEKKLEISFPLEHLCRFAINERRDIELGLKREFRKIFYEYPLGKLDSRIQIAMDPLGGFLDKITTIVFSPWCYVEDEMYLRLTCEMRKLRFNKEGSKKQTTNMLTRFQEPSNQLQHNENEFVNVSRRINQDKSFSQEQEQPSVASEHVHSFRKDYPSRLTAVNIPKEVVSVGPVRSHNESIFERNNKTNSSNTTDLPTANSPKAKVSNKCLLDMNCRELMSFLNNKPEEDDSISISRQINYNEPFTNKQYESEINCSGTLCVAEPQLDITCAFLTRCYTMVIPYETSLKDLINIIEQQHNIKVNINNLYFKNGADDRINLVDEEDWIVARLEAKEVMNNKIVLYFSHS
ncbi:3200_t:CDS:2 [Funneliformis geosporum]|uniref:8043_t:CDS:1 n=1 Tax=Funneliformis geosporum TaxID=1117311 RepID=A0A9W4T1C1_9GLOM|nr:8043_t:CDS:2 [Funneliformis geosporum]CAI2191162.1 3200_t:CDS:2 [Funneliformis geosporum]